MIDNRRILISELINLSGRLKEIVAAETKTAMEEQMRERDYRVVLRNIAKIIIQLEDYKIDMV